MNTAQKLSDLQILEQRIEKLEKKPEQEKQDRLSLFCFSGEWDRIFSAFVIGTGAAAAGTEVHMFFTFWATAALRKKAEEKMSKSFFEKMFGFMLPRGASKIRLSKFHFGGLGLGIMNKMMKDKGISSLEELMDVAGELDIKISVCEMSMDIIGFKRGEIFNYPNLQYCGVQNFLEEASSSKLTLYI